jgi:hypothetical protein
MYKSELSGFGATHGDNRQSAEFTKGRKGFENKTGTDEGWEAEANVH